MALIRGEIKIILT